MDVKIKSVISFKIKFPLNIAIWKTIWANNVSIADFPVIFLQAGISVMNLFWPFKLFLTFCNNFGTEHVWDKNTSDTLLFF